jgi:hypothetical protein
VRVGAVVALGLLAGCGKSPVASQDFARDYAQASCAQSARCNLLDAALIAACEGSVGAVLGDDVQKGIAAGRIHYDEDLARSCIDGIRGAPCLRDGLPDSVQADCLAAVSGTVAPGASCTGLFECAGGLCVPSTAGACPSACPTVLGPAASCSLHQGPECDVRQSLTCIQGQCRTPGKDGAACDTDLDCDTEHVCSAGTCAPLLGQDAECDGDAACQAGLACIEERCVQRAGEGAPCARTPDEADAAFRFAQCSEGLVCRGSGLTTTGDAVPGTCQRPSDLGGSCTDEPAGLQEWLDGCLTGLLCASGRCGTPPATGACAPHDACDSTVAYCDAGQCLPLKDDGAACLAPSECRSGGCTAGECAPAVEVCHWP